MNNFFFSNSESDTEGRYDIFTSEKEGKYLIYGLVTLTGFTSGDEVILKQTSTNDQRTIVKKDINKTVKICEEVLLVSNITISLHFRASCTNNLFHVFELWPGWNREASKPAGRVFMSVYGILLPKPVGLAVVQFCWKHAHAPISR